jgi:type I restriction enzyme M protein
MVYGIDFDARSVKIAKALNLIAGDGRSNVYRLNTLDPTTWDQEGQVSLRPRLRRFPEKASDQENQRTYRYFDFDILMTNPPFAGEIKDTRMLHKYELARRDDGKWQPSMGRDVLFIERNLDFLKPGGRMAIVLPQGRFNNLGDERIRRFIAEQCRILAVVGLHGNTFKPHTGTKTSVLFLQKWNDDPKAGPLCRRVEDYPIFFATSEHGGKDNSGDYIFLKRPHKQDVLNLFNHQIVDHDLYDERAVLKQQLEKLLERDKDDPAKRAEHRKHYKEVLAYIPQRPTIAEAFIDFAKRQNFPFWREGK